MSKTCKRQCSSITDSFTTCSTQISPLICFVFLYWSSIKRLLNIKIQRSCVYSELKALHSEILCNNQSFLFLSESWAQYFGVAIVMTVEPSSSGLGGYVVEDPVVTFCDLSCVYFPPHSTLLSWWIYTVHTTSQTLGHWRSMFTAVTKAFCFEFVSI